MHGIVRDGSGKPIAGAVVVLNGGVRVFTAEGGHFHALLAPGSHNIEAIADGYKMHQKVHSPKIQCACPILFCRPEARQCSRMINNDNDYDCTI